MLKSSSCDYSDAYILKGTISVATTVGAGAKINNKKVISKICALLTDCMSEINNKQLDNVKSIDVVIPIHKLIE